MKTKAIQKCKHNFEKLTNTNTFWFLTVLIKSTEESFVCTKCGKVIE
jgi:transcription initiation factor IIE alpha subunit